jgi:glutamate-ammonia-ligase adenylyltransferase
MGCATTTTWAGSPSTMGYADCCPFLHELDGHRELVAEEFDKLLGGGGTECKGCAGPKGNGKAPAGPGHLLEQLPAQLQQRIERWRKHPRVLALRDDARARLSRLVARTGAVAAGGPRQRGSGAAHGRLDRAAAAPRELPRAAVGAARRARALLRLLGAARWPARYLMQHPGVIDELASDGLLTERFSAEDFERELEHRRARCRSPARTTTRPC